MNFYEYIKNSRKEIPGVDDKLDYRILREAMDIMKFSQELQFNFFKIIACILHMGNIKPTKDRDDQAHLNDMSSVEKLCHLLGVSSADFSKNLLRPEIKAGNDWVAQSRTVGQVLYSLESLARAIYERMFERLVEYINQAINRNIKQKCTFIGVLDIAGFEIFDINSLEQLWINYTNEKLQQFFNHYMFQREQEEYQKEDIKWDFIDFGLDLQPTIDLIEKANPIGILSCLDEECVMPKATDKTFTEKLNSIWLNQNQKYEPLKFKQGFIICHYASKVEYITYGWLDKNKDPLNENITKLIASSSDKFISYLFEDYKNTKQFSVRPSRKRGVFRTVSQRHKEQLALLMNQLNLTEPHFVRCILPNHEKKPGKLDIRLVIDQLRCNGVLEGIRICRAGFPNRLLFSEFRHRYQILANAQTGKGFMDSKKATQLLLEEIELDKSQYRLGTSKVFFRAGVLGVLEEVRDKKVSSIVSLTQSLCRGFLSRKKYNKRSNQFKAILIIQKNARIYNNLREWPWWRLYTKVKPLLNVTRVDEEIRRRDELIKKLEHSIEIYNHDKTKITKSLENIILEKKEIEDTLFSERNHAIDNQEILRRTQERIIYLEEELNLLTKEYEGIDNNIEEYKKTIENLKLDIDNYKSKFKEEARTNQIYKLQIEKYENIFSENQNQIKEISNNNEKQELEINQLVINIKEYKQKINLLEESIEEQKNKYENEISQLNTHISQLNETNNFSNIKSKNIEDNYKIKENEVHNYININKNLQNIIEKLKKEIQHFSESTNNEKQKNLELENGIKKYKLENEVSNEKINALKSENTKLKDDNKTQLKQLYELRQTIEQKGDLENKHEAIRLERENEIQKLQSINEKLNSQIKNFKITNVKQIETLKLEIESRTNEINKSNDIMHGYEQKIKNISEENSNLQTMISNIRIHQKQSNEQIEELLNKNQKLEFENLEIKKMFEDLKSSLVSTKSKTQDLEKLYNKERENNNKLNEMLNENKLLYETNILKLQSLEKLNAKFKNSIDQMSKHIEEQNQIIDDLNLKLNSKNEEIELNNVSIKEELDLRIQYYESKNKEMDDRTNELQLKLNNSQKETESLLKTKSKLCNEMVDLKHELEKETVNNNININTIKNLEEEYNKLESNYKSEKAENINLKNNISKLQNELEMVNIQLEEKEIAYKNLVNIKNQLENDLKDLIKEINRDNNTVFELEKEKRKTESNIQNILNKLKLSEKNNLKLEKEYERLNIINKNLSTQLKDKDEKMDELRRSLLDEIDRLGDRLTNQTETYKEELISKKKLEEENIELHQNIDKLRTRNNFDEEKLKYDETISDLQTKIENEIQLKHDFEGLAKRHENKANILQDELEKLELQIETLQTYKRKNEQKIMELSQELEDSRNNYNTQIETFNNEIEFLKNKTSELEEMNYKLETELNKNSRRKGIPEEFISEKIKKLEDNNKAMLISQKNLQKEIDYKNNEINRLEHNNLNYIKEINKFKTIIEENKYEIEELNIQISEIKHIQNVDIEKIDEMNDQLTKYRTKMNDLSAEIDSYKLKLQKYNKIEFEYNKKLDEYETNLNIQLNSQNNYIAKINELENEIENLNTKLINYNQESDKANKLLTQYEKIKAETIKGLEERDAIISSIKHKYEEQLSELAISFEKERQKCLVINEVNEKLRQKIDTFNTNSDEYDVKNSEFESKYNDLQNQLNETLITNQKYSEEVEDLRQQLILIGTEKDNLKNNIDLYETENNNLKKSIKKLEVQLKESISTLKDRKVDQSYVATNNIFEPQMDSYVLKIRKLNDINKNTKEELEEYKVRTKDLQDKNIKLEKEIQDNRLKLISLESQSSLNKNLTDTIRKLNPEIVLPNNGKEINEIKKNLKKLESENRDIKFNLRLKTNELEQSQLTIKKLNNKVNEITKELNEIESNYNETQINRNRYERENTELKDHNVKLQRDLSTIRQNFVKSSSLLSHSSTINKTTRLSNITEHQVKENHKHKVDEITTNVSNDDITHHIDERSSIGSSFSETSLQE